MPLRVTVELYRKRRTSEGWHITRLAEMTIENVTGDRRDDAYADYLVEARSTRGPARTGRVQGHARLAEPVWNLVAKALHAAGYG